MLRPALVAVLGLVLTVSAASGQRNADCAETYKSNLEKLERMKISPERRAALRRWALRVYEACQTGDIEDAQGLFDRLKTNLP
jgi:hypothetical protein